MNEFGFTSEQDAEEAILTFIKKYVSKNASPLCGNTISQDRRFLVKFMPKLEAYLHYRNLDVSTLKELSKRWKPEVFNSFKKQQKHTALADVHESIAELRHYRRLLLAEPWNAPRAGGPTFAGDPDRRCPRGGRRVVNMATLSAASRRSGRRATF